MLVSLVGHKQSHPGHSHDPPKTAENPLQDKLTKLSMNMKNYCSIHLRLLHSQNGDSMHSLFMLNPECQIKILEENFLNKKGSSCKEFQIKSNYNSFKSTLKTTSLVESKQSPLTSGALLKDQMAFNLNSNIVGNNDFVSEVQSNIAVSNGTNSDSSNSENLHVSIKNIKTNKQKIPSPSMAKVKDKYSSSKKRLNSASLLKTGSNSSPLTNEVENISSDAKNNENDSQFEFTVEQEKIVSFVCSPSPPRKQRIQAQENCNNNETKSSDQESEMSSSKGDSVSETLSNTSCKSSNSFNFEVKDDPTWEQLQKAGKSLWCPPSPQKPIDQTLADKQPVYLFSSNKLVKTHSAESIVSFHGSVNNISSLTNQKRVKTSTNQETILFREASLRGCYNIENILKNMVPPLDSVEQEVSKVRESIFSAIRLQKSNNDVVQDTVLSILDICKSWIKLNSHFEREDFKETLQVNGVEPTILCDFLQWQCVTRTFIDKMIHVLNKITLKQNADSNVHNNPHNVSNLNSISTRYFNQQHHNLSNDYINIGFSNNSNEIEQFGSLPKGEMVQNKHWKQRRFFPDQEKSGISDVKTKRLCKSKLTVSSSYNGPLFPGSSNTEMVFGQGDNGPMSYNCGLYFNKSNNLLPNKNCHMVPDLNFFTNGSNFLQQDPEIPAVFDKNTNLCSTQAISMKELQTVRNESSIYPLAPVDDLLCNSSSNVIDLPVNHNSPINTQPFPTIPPIYGNPFCFLNPNQVHSSLSQCMIKPNPIQCIDTDVSENCIKSSYMKPGSYNPPQKPASYQRTINNNIPIEDIPVVGIRFLYASSQNNTQQLKSLKTSNSLQQIQTLTENSCVKKSDDTWRAALSLAESVRDSLMCTKLDSPNLRVSETVSLKSHFLLSDEASQHSSVNELKPDSGPEELSPPDNPSSGIELSVVEAHLKTTDWLIKSFNKAVSENEKLVNKNSSEIPNNHQEHELSGINPTNEERLHRENQTGKSSSVCIKVSKSNKNDTDNNSSDRLSNTSLVAGESNLMNHFLQGNGLNLSQRKSRKNKRIRDDYGTVFEHKPSSVRRKQQSIFKRSITKQVSSKLEDILNCIWNTEVSNLVEEELKSEKEATRLELKIRSPLYFQAMKCKLTNQSYDTLEQALADLYQYFLDIKSRNKGDKQCIEVVCALEQIFLNLVEKHFGLIYEPAPQYFGPIGMAPSLKSRRPKKSSRRF